MLKLWAGSGFHAGHNARRKGGDEEMEREVHPQEVTKLIRWLASPINCPPLINQVMMVSMFEGCLSAKLYRSFSQAKLLFKRL